MRIFLPLLTLLAAAASACGGAISDPNAKTDTQTSQDQMGRDGGPVVFPAPTAPTATGTPSPPPPQPPSPPSGCSTAQHTSPTSFTSQADVIAHLGHVWRACGDVSSQGFHVGGPAGFEVQPDGHFYALGYDGEGHVVRQTGFANEGRMTFIAGQDGPDIVSPDNSFLPIFASLSEDGTTVSFSSEGGQAGPFFWSNEAVSTPPTYPPGAHEGAAACSTPETGVIDQPATPSEATAAVLGTWTRCGDLYKSYPGTLPAAIVGVQFSTDGTWSFLVTSNGAPAPSTDPAWHGTFSFQTAPRIDGTMVSTISLLSSDGGTYGAEWAVSTSPVKLELLTEGWAVVFSAE
jgi:hypothetical protein